MKLESTGKQDRLAEVQDLYSRASMTHEKHRANLKRYDEQYRGGHTIDTMGDE